MRTTRKTAESPTVSEPSEVESARADVVAQREVLAQWQQRRREAEAELAGLEDRAGVEILDNPDAQDEIDETIDRLRRRVRNAEKAIEAQRPRIMVAESAYLAAEADALEPRVTVLAAELAAHEAKTAELLKALEDHEGEFVPARKLHNAIWSSDTVVMGERPTLKLEKSVELKRALSRVRFQVGYLREMAAGSDPQHLVSSWPHVSGPAPIPDCVQGPEALVPTASYLASVEHARQVVDDLEELRVILPREIEEYRRTVALHAPDQEYAQPIARREQRLAGLDEEIAAARAHLEQLAPSAGS